MPEFPEVVRRGAVQVKIYLQRSKTTRSKVLYCVSWVGSRGVEHRYRADYAAAKTLALNQAERLRAGLQEGGRATENDLRELREAREKADALGLPLLSALDELAAARRIAGTELVLACEAWVKRKGGKLDRLLVSEAVRRFVAERVQFGGGERTYGPKFRVLQEALGERYLDSLTVQDWLRYLDRFENAVTKNDYRRRCVTLCLWARKRGHLPKDEVPSVVDTPLAKADRGEIGILSPETFGKVLELVRAERPKGLPALVLSGFCGLRAQEADAQRWEDIRETELNVSQAKSRTPRNRHVPLCAAATAWLEVCRSERGLAGSPGGLTATRSWLKRRGFVLPQNCFRHSWISYRIAQCGDKARVATEAGNSPEIIDSNYRRPVPAADAEDWFNLRPAPAN